MIIVGEQTLDPKEAVGFKPQAEGKDFQILNLRIIDKSEFPVGVDPRRIRRYDGYLFSQTQTE